MSGGGWKVSGDGWKWVERERRKVEAGGGVCMA